MISRFLSLAVFVLGLTTLLSCGRAETERPETVWEGLRSAVIYVRVPDDSTRETLPITVSWTPAWIADSQRERLYWYDPAGELLERIEIERSQPSGAVSLTLQNGPGDYRLVIPGYSFRKYKVTVPEPYPSVIEPEKLHFSMEIGSGHLFWTGPLHSGRLKLKSHDGRAALAVSSPTGNTVLAHQGGGKYRDHKTLNLALANSQVSLTVTDGGKFSFWLDGAANYFSQSASDWFEPTWRPGKAVFTVSSEAIGETTHLGTYTEFAPLPRELKDLLRDARPSVVHSYIFEDVMKNHTARDRANHRAIAELGIEQSYGLLSRTVRDSVPESASGSASFLETYLSARFAQNLPIDIIAFVDEPNLRYRSYRAYEAYHLKLAETVRSLNDALGVDVKIAAPESSRMVNGPTNSPRRFQSGFSWTENLLHRHWDTVDVISWHMWQYRYLEALDQFPETIEEVSELNDRLARENGETPKALSISQTNLGSGPNTSTYHQNTYYSGLWWASVAAQSIATGKLDHLIWFKAVDEGPYGKGLLMRENGQLVRKPIAQAMIFINEAILPETLAATSSAHEVDLAAMRAPNGEASLLCVNKSRRDYAIQLNTDSLIFETVEFLDRDGTIEALELTPMQQSGDETLRLPAQTICRLSGKPY